MERCVEKEARGEVLDMGTGSGIQAISAARNTDVAKVIAVDISAEALRTAEQNALAAGVLEKIVFRQSDLFRTVSERFDTILFNPPYLPTEPEKPGDECSRAWDGGATGSEVVRRFLDEAGAHLKPNGRILLVLSSLTGITLDEIERDFEVDILLEEALFFERLYCLSLVEKSHVSVQTAEPEDEIWR